ncbi:MAG: small multi-drug export protein [bacterium]
MEALLKVFILSMTPFGELRLAIPVGILIYQLNTALVFLVSVAGNLVPAFFVLFFFKRFSPYFSKKFQIFRKLINLWESNAIKKHSRKIQKYEFLGLMLLIGIPLPLTGVYTGALLAALMNMAFKKSIPAIFAGVVISGIIVTSLVIFGINIQDYLGWQVVLGIILLSGLLYWYLKRRITKRL